MPTDIVGVRYISYSRLALSMFSSLLLLSDMSTRQITKLAQAMQANSSNSKAYPRKSYLPKPSFDENGLTDFSF